MKKSGVICAIDVNDFEQDLVDLAAIMAKNSQMDLDLLHVTMSPDSARAAWPAFPNSETVFAANQKRLKSIRTSVRDVQIHIHHLSGLPSREVIGFVRRNDPQLLILGTRIKTGIRRVFGSIATKIMCNVECPVMIFKHGPDKD